VGVGKTQFHTGTYPVAPGMPQTTTTAKTTGEVYSNILNINVMGMA
jgi:hypothetical protein